MGASRLTALTRGALLALAVGATGCPDSTPPRTGLEPSSPVSAPAPARPRSDEERYAGAYLYAGSDSERAAIRAAVDHATEGMVGKNIARGELMKRSEVRQSYTLRFDGKGNVTIESPGYPPETSSLDGTEAPFKNKYGDALQNKAHFVGGALLQESRTADGGGTTQFRLQPDDRTLIVTRISRSPKLPGTVQFSLTYTR
ncbi:MAG TPA: hypothetical protein VFF12_12280 [Myxococcaceae bacterium]|nr:hypothetical protein [Myxococcaceae bacterium]